MRRRLTAEDVARACGVSRRRVSAVEASIEPTPEWVARYLAAVDAVADRGRVA